MRYVSVQVLSSGGSPQHNARVAIEVHQFAASGMKTEYTKSDGVAQFDLDVDQFAEITIYVDGRECVSRGSIKAEYRVVV